MYSNRSGQRGHRAPNPYRQNFQFVPMSQPTAFVPNYAQQRPQMQRMPRAPRFHAITRASQRRPTQYRPPKREFSSNGDLAAQAAQIATQAYQQGVQHTFQMMAKQPHRLPPQNQRTFQQRPTRNISQNYNRQRQQPNRPNQQNNRNEQNHQNGDPLQIIAGMQQQIADLTQRFQHQNIANNDGDAPMQDAIPPVRITPSRLRKLKSDETKFLRIFPILSPNVYQSKQRQKNGFQ